MSIKTLEYIEKIMKNVELQKNRMKSSAYNDSIVCFRGESEDFQETKLTPSLFREQNHVLLERELLNLLSDYGIADSTNTSKLSKSIAGQHFIQTSRLLDITFSILPALYFASHDNNKDGYVYSFVFPESFSPNSDYLNNYYDNLVEGKFIPYARDFKVITHSYDNERVKMQSGGFILFTGEIFSKIPKEYYCTPVKILSGDKLEIRKELSKFFNLNESTLFPEKDKRKEVILSRLSKTNKNKNNLEHYINVELEYSLRRIVFETDMKMKSVDETQKKIRRFLRKEKESLFNYIDNNYSLDVEKAEKKNIIERKFTFIETGVYLKNELN